MVFLEVTDSPKMVFFKERHGAFGYKLQEFKSEIMFTPQEAIQERRNSLLTSIGMYAEKLKERQAELESLNALELNCK